MDGVLILDKPAGMTSHDAVNRLRRITGERSIGHLGTLDPMATGVLPMLLGRMTRLAQFYLHCEKTYEGEIRLGYATDTYDATGEPSGPPVAVNCQEREAEIRAAATGFIGVIEQTPPPYSAKKISGVPAYKLARKNKAVELKPVQVEIKKLEITSVQADLVSFRAQVASGTYLRSIAHDLGRQVGVGGHLASLRRTAVGEFGIGEAHGFEKLDHIKTQPLPSPMSDNEYYVKSELGQYLRHPRTLLPAFPSVSAPPETLPRLLNGNAVNLPEFSSAKMVKVFRNQTDLIAVVQRVAGTLFQPKVVLGVVENQAMETCHRK
ncbi:MAG TPA: tRNA pseudouridine(55) synthase TruB [Terriglobales bacterium]|jgi:tRNA pseudouridine55 synthase|nr:tRNA pseudouridine(55) synthase TruB [Terriglobales bacterium]